ncbi:MAG: PAS domain-containing protein, partial [Deltaproteobacteria bacterium]
MAGSTDRPSRLRRLRERAEQALSKEVPVDNDLSQLPSEDLRRLVHELRVHQIELDIQNEELRRARVEVEESRDRYTDLYDFAPVGYLTLSDKGLIKQINLTGSRLLGVERAFLIHRPLSRFVKQEDLSAYYEYWRELFRSG